jgi:hypothetical protein
MAQTDEMVLGINYKGNSICFCLENYLMRNFTIQVIYNLNRQLENCSAILGNQALPLIILTSMCQVIPEDVVKSLLAACRSGEFDVANKEVSNIIADGYPVSQLMAQVTIYPVFRCHTLVDY